MKNMSIVTVFSIISKYLFTQPILNNKENWRIVMLFSKSVQELNLHQPSKEDKMFLFGSKHSLSKDKTHKI